MKVIVVLKKQYKHLYLKNILDFYYLDDKLKQWKR